jgi:hypothetical protein
MNRERGLVCKELACFLPFRLAVVLGRATLLTTVPNIRSDPAHILTIRLTAIIFSIVHYPLVFPVTCKLM